MKIRHIPVGRDRRRRRFRIFLLSVLALFAVGLLSVAGVYMRFSRELPRLNSIEDYRPALPTIMYDRDGVEASRFFTENRDLIRIDQVPRHVILAVLAIEDAKFYEHKGIDYLGIFRAAIKNMAAGHVVQGGSTITQQIAKSLLLSNERTYKRKIKEAILARRISKGFTKDQVLEIYLNQSYFGAGSYGIETAAQTYLSKHVWELTLPEAALLAGLPKAPSAYDPIRSPDKALARRNHVLARMADEGFISAEERDRESALGLALNPHLKPKDDPNAYFAEEVRRYLYEKYGEDALYRGGMKVYTTLDTRFQRLAQEAVRAGLRELDKRQGYRGPIERVGADRMGEVSALLSVENGLAPAVTPAMAGTATGPAPALSPPLPAAAATGAPWEAGRILRALVVRVGKDATLDVGGLAAHLPVQEMAWARRPNPEVEGADYPVRSADEVLRPGYLVLARFTGSVDPLHGPVFALEQEPVVEGALVCMDAPTGQVLALIGGYDYSRSEFNRATQARRQPGSAFKPVIYSAAMDNGLTPSSIIVDSPIIYDDPSQELKWKPSNFEEKFYGPTTLRTALTKSRNVITIKIVQKLGLPVIAQYARQFGLDKQMPQDLSVSLGSLGVTPLELTTAFSAFANLGERAIPWFVTRATDRDGNVLETGMPQLIRVLSEDTAFIMQNLLRGVVQTGTGWRAKALGHPSGGKTGTTNDMLNAWFMGFTPRVVTGVWVGFDTETTMGVNETGSRAALPIWLQFMTEALENQPVLPFPPSPPGIEMVRVEPESGLLAGSGVDKFIYEAFKSGTAPREYARVGARREGGDGESPFAPGILQPSDLPGILPRDF